MTNIPTHPHIRRRLPAEWEAQSAIMLAWPHEDTDWSYMLPEVIDCFKQIAATITGNGEHLVILTPNPDATALQLPDINGRLVSLKQVSTNDTWARDTCAITTFSADGKPEINDFMFNGWGLKFAADYDNLITSRLFEKGTTFNAIYVNRLNFVLEGGSIESNGKGTILTTSQCLLSKNRNGGYSQEEIEEQLKSFFGANRILWLDHGYMAGDDTDSHVDTLARFAPNDTIVYVATNNPNDEHYEELAKMEAQLKSFRTENGDNYKLIPVPLPSPIYDEDDLRLPATYANFLICNGFVAVPTYGQPDNDKAAMEAIAKAFPGRKIVGIDCNALIKQHGSLHCVTMQFPENVIKF